MSNIIRVIAMAVLTIFSLQTLTAAGENAVMAPATNQYVMQFSVNETKAAMPSLAFSRENQMDSKKQRTINIIILSVMGAIIVGTGVAFAVNQR